jgi:hypothetical protein
LPFNVSSDVNIAISQYYSRLRISTDSVAILRPFSVAAQGETEDHLLLIGGIAVTSIVDTSICNGNSITISSHTYNIPGTYIDTLLSISGCDSIQTTNLTISPLNPMQGLYVASSHNYLKIDPFTGSVEDTINTNTLNLGWVNASSTINERDAKIYWISETIELHTLDLLTGTETTLPSDIASLPFFWSLRYFNGFLYTFTTSADNDKMLVRIDPSTGNLDTGFAGIELNGSSNYGFSAGSSPVIHASTSKLLIPAIGNVIFEFDILNHVGNIIQLSGFILNPPVLNLLEMNEYTGEMYGLAGYNHIVNIARISDTLATVSLVKTLTSASGYSNPISTFDSENDFYIFQAAEGCSAQNPIVTIDVITGQEWCVDPPEVAFFQMEFLNCSPVSQLRKPNPNLIAE